MKSTGIVRKVDELGRVVIPIELRRFWGLTLRMPWNIRRRRKDYLKKYEPACIFCGSADNVRQFSGRIVCQECIDKMER